MFGSSDGVVVKITGCSFSKAWFNSWYSHDDSNYLYLLPGHSKSFCNLCAHRVCMWNTEYKTNNHIHKEKINQKLKKNCCLKCGLPL